MDKIGLLRDVLESAESIDQGRKWLATDGLEANGRAAYKFGLESAMDAFKLAQSQATNDLELLVLAEQSFILQELQFCDSTDTDAKSSLEQANNSFDDALRSLEVVSDSLLYFGAEKTYPTGAPFIGASVVASLVPLSISFIEHVDLLNVNHSW